MDTYSQTFTGFFSQIVYPFITDEEVCKHNNDIISNSPLLVFLICLMGPKQPETRTILINSNYLSSIPSHKMSQNVLFLFFLSVFFHRIDTKNRKNSTCPTKHLFILVSAPSWYLTCINLCTHEHYAFCCVIWIKFASNLVLIKHQNFKIDAGPSRSAVWNEFSEQH